MDFAPRGPLRLPLALRQKKRKRLGPTDEVAIAVLEVRSCLHGIGVFALAAFNKGADIRDIDNIVVTTTPGPRRGSDGRSS